MIDYRKKTEVQTCIDKRFKNRDWIEENFQSIQEKYKEKWIAVAGKKVVGTGEDPEIIKKELDRVFSSLEIVLLRVPEGDISQPV